VLLYKKTVHIFSVLYRRFWYSKRF